MRALVISAFALTLFISAITVYMALSSDTLDGEPYAVIAIEPPKKSFTASTPSAATPAASKAAEPVREATVTTSQTADVAKTTPEPAAVPQPVVDATSSTPTLTPTTAIDSSDDDAIEEALARTDDATVTEDPVNRRTTEVARPVSTTQDTTADPFFSAEPGIGLGVGNLGPLDPAKAN